MEVLCGLVTSTWFVKDEPSPTQFILLTTLKKRPLKPLRNIKNNFQRTLSPLSTFFSPDFSDTSLQVHEYLSSLTVPHNLVF